MKTLIRMRAIQILASGCVRGFLPEKVSLSKEDKTNTREKKRQNKAVNV